MTRVMNEYRRKLKALQNDRGVALLICLLVMAILTVVVLEFHYEIQVDAALTQNSFLALEAEYAARSGVTFCLALLRQDAEADLLMPDGRRTDTLAEPWALGLQPTQVARGVVAARITDEESRFNINRVISTKDRKDDPLAVLQLKQLFSQLELPPEMTDPILDWIDFDSVQRQAGAESNYYQSLRVPYVCKNSWFDSIAELALVKGFSRAMVLGQGTNPLIIETEGAKPLTSASQVEIIPGLADFLTASASSEGRVNINTAPETVIRAIFNQNPLAAESIISERQRAPFENMLDLKQRVPTVVKMKEIGRNITFSSNRFSIVSEGEVHGMRVRIETVVLRLAGPEGISFKTVAWKVTT